MHRRNNDELRSALRGAVEATAANEAELARLRNANSGGVSGKAVRGILFLTIALLAWIWIGKPAWVFGDRPTPPGPVEAEAQARYGIYLKSALIEEYIQKEGQLPQSLAELGGDSDAGITLTVGRGTEYQLSAAGPAKRLVYSSRMNADSFLGNSLEVLREAQR